MGSAEGVSREKLVALERPLLPDLFSQRERLALEYADAMTKTELDVDDELFARLCEYFDEDAILELTLTIAWENASSKFNRALRIPSQDLWPEGGE